MSAVKQHLPKPPPLPTWPGPQAVAGKHSRPQVEALGNIHGQASPDLRATSVPSKSPPEPWPSSRKLSGVVKQRGPSSGSDLSLSLPLSGFLFTPVSSWGSNHTHSSTQQVLTTHEALGPSTWYVGIFVPSEFSCELELKSHFLGNRTQT